MESVVRQRIEDGDTALALIEGLGIITAEHLDDGIHPGDEGHKRIAAAVVKVLTASLKSAKAAATADDDEAVATADDEAVATA